MDEKNIKHFEEKLKEELKTLEEELSTISRRNPNNPEDWEATPQEMDIDKSDLNEVADGFEGYEENTAILKQLEIRYNNLKTALKNIKEGRYGLCQECGEKIETDRLEANPAATTCKKHLK